MTEDKQQFDYKTLDDVINTSKKQSDFHLMNISHYLDMGMKYSFTLNGAAAIAVTSMFTTVFISKPYLAKNILLSLSFFVFALFVIVSAVILSYFAHKNLKINYDEWFNISKEVKDNTICLEKEKKETDIELEDISLALEEKVHDKDKKNIQTRIDNTKLRMLKIAEKQEKQIKDLPNMIDNNGYDLKFKKCIMSLILCSLIFFSMGIFVAIKPFYKEINSKSHQENQINICEASYPECNNILISPTKP